MKFNQILILFSALGLALTPAFASQETPGPSSSSEFFFNRYFDEPFFSRSDAPLEEMRHVRNDLLKDLNVAEKNEVAFDRWFKGKYGGSIEDVHQRQDDAHYYYDVAVKDLKDEKFGAEVKNGEITLRGSLKRKLASGTEISRFTRSFPAPRNLDPNHVQITSGDGIITVQFAKRVPGGA